MRTLILASVIRILIPVFLVFAVYMFFRGHNMPGGGFIAGLVASIPYMVHTMAFGSNKTREEYKIKPMFMAGIGLFIAALSALFGILQGFPVMTALWMETELPIVGKIGTPTFFDIGVFFVVMGVVLKITFLLTEEQEEK
jgi:multicomponent Na+:H+ antiporter subunit B